MAKENNTITLIHRDLLDKKKETIKTRTFTLVDKYLVRFLLKANNKNTIKIIDKTFCKNKKYKEFVVNNHVNKTGENPRRGNQALSKQPFFDITSLYLKSTQGITTTSLGKQYFKMKNKAEYLSTHMSNVAISCKALGFKKTKGVLINNHKA